MENTGTSPFPVKWLFEKEDPGQPVALGYFCAALCRKKYDKWAACG
jgi:hypothetical protein